MAATSEVLLSSLSVALSITLEYEVNVTMMLTTTFGPDRRSIMDKLVHIHSNVYMNGLLNMDELCRLIEHSTLLFTVGHSN